MAQAPSLSKRHQQPHGLSSELSSEEEGSDLVSLFLSPHSLPPAQGSIERLQNKRSLMQLQKSLGRFVRGSCLGARCGYSLTAAPGAREGGIDLTDPKKKQRKKNKEKRKKKKQTSNENKYIRCPGKGRGKNRWEQLGAAPGWDGLREQRGQWHGGKCVGTKGDDY